MIDTRLILIEGPPGSGKTSTAQFLSSEISNSGISCQCFFEWSEDNPIAIGDDLHLDKAVSSSISRENEVLEQWKHFVRIRQADQLVTVMESRFWQTSLMLMYASGSPLERILSSNQRVVETIEVLKPVLIRFAIDDLRAFMRRTLQIKEDEWQRAGSPGSWAQHVFDAFNSQKWFTDRRLTGLTGMLAFLEEWASITDKLYNGVGFPKITIRNPYLDWSTALKQIHSFLGLA